MVELANSLLPLHTIDLGEIFALSSLEEAFDHILRKGGPAAGGDGISVHAYAIDAKSRLNHLSGKLLSKSHIPGPVDELPIRKKSGGMRILRIPCVGDRIAQRALAVAMSSVLDQHFENSSFAYRPGRSVQLAARRISASYRRGYDHVFEGDIDDYFDEVDHSKLMRKLVEFGADRELLRTIEKWLGQTATSGKGLPQGAPISPILANLFLDDLDEVMGRREGQWIRYADDFVFLGKTLRSVQKAREACAHHLHALGLRLHPAKTRLGTFDGGFSYLGRVFLKSFILEDQDGLDKDELAELNIRPEISEPTTQPIRYFRKAPAPDTSDDGIDDPVPDDELRKPEEGVKPIDKKMDVPHPNRQIRESIGKVHLTTLYVLESGREIQQNGHMLEVAIGGEIIWQRHITEIDRIDVGASSKITTDALKLAIENGVALFFLKRGGDTLSISGRESNARAGLQLEQARFAIAREENLILSRLLIETKIYNQRRVIQRWVSNLAERINKAEGLAAQELADRKNKLVVHLKPLDSARKKCTTALTTGSLLGLEGPSTDRLYTAMKIVLQGFTFTNRERKAPGDPVNHLMNLFAWMLARDMETVVAAKGLHPGFGFFHVVGNNRSSLVYDLMEPFRAPVCEALTVNCLNRGWINSSDFPQWDGDATTFTPRLTREGIQKAIRAYERWVAPGRLKYNGKAGYGWRDFFSATVDSYIGHISTGSTFSPYQVDM